MQRRSRVALTVIALLFAAGHLVAVFWSSGIPMAVSGEVTKVETRSQANGAKIHLVTVDGRKFAEILKPFNANSQLRTEIVDGAVAKQLRKGDLVLKHQWSDQIMLFTGEESITLAPSRHAKRMALLMPLLVAIVALMPTFHRRFVRVNDDYRA